MFGTIHGFTQRGATGINALDEVTLPELEGLKTSAVALALTLVLEYVLPNNEKMRAKKIGKFGRCTFTVTMGLIPNAASASVQSRLARPRRSSRSTR